MPEIATYTIKVTIHSEKEDVKPLKISALEIAVEDAIEDEYDTSYGVDPDSIEVNVTATRDDI